MNPAFSLRPAPKRFTTEILPRMSAKRAVTLDSTAASAPSRRRRLRNVVTMAIMQMPIQSRYPAVIYSDIETLTISIPTTCMPMNMYWTAISSNTASAELTNRLFFVTNDPMKVLPKNDNECLSMVSMPASLTLSRCFDSKAEFTKSPLLKNSSLRGNIAIRMTAVTITRGEWVTRASTTF